MGSKPARVQSGGRPVAKLVDLCRGIYPNLHVSVLDSFFHPCSPLPAQVIPSTHFCHARCCKSAFPKIALFSGSLLARRPPSRRARKSCRPATSSWRPCAMSHRPGRLRRTRHAELDFGMWWVVLNECIARCFRWFLTQYCLPVESTEE